MTAVKKLSLAALIFFVGLILFLSIGSFSAGALKFSLIPMLVKAEPMPSGLESPAEAHTVIYVLGGGEQSLESRFKIASDLYHKRMASKIIILSRPGKTEYSTALERNLTSDEWSMEKLASFGVPKTDIELVKVKEGFFGTLSEAEAIPNLVSNRGYTTLILVSSQYHTMRAWESFSKFSKDKNLRLYIYTSKDHSGGYTTLEEYLKLEFYRLFLINGLSTAT